MNWSGISAGAVDEMYEEALEFFRIDAGRHQEHGRQTYSDEIKHHLGVIEEKVRRLSGKVHAVAPPKPYQAKGYRIAVVVGGKRYESVARAAAALGVHKWVINRMIRDGEAQRA